MSSSSTSSSPTSERRCGYSQCARVLDYDGRGRPPEYCSDRKWPDGRTCKQLAAAERAAERAVGLDAPLESFRASTDRFVPTVEALSHRLSELVESVGQVHDGALARIGQAERAADSALSESVAAHADRDHALRLCQEAVEARERAEAQAAEALAQAAEAQRVAQERVDAAWREVAQAHRAQGSAQAEAAAQAENAQMWCQRAHQAQERMEAAQVCARQRAEECAGAVRRAEVAEALAHRQVKEVEVVTERLRVVQAEADQRCDQWRQQAAVSAHQAQVAERTACEAVEECRGHRVAEAEGQVQLQRLRVELAEANMWVRAAREAQAAAEGRAKVAEDRARSAEGRVDEIVAVWKAGRSAGSRVDSGEQ